MEERSIGGKGERVYKVLAELEDVLCKPHVTTKKNLQ